MSGMKKRIHTFAGRIFASLAICAALALLNTATAATEDEIPGWHKGWTLAPYGWLAGLDGTVGAKTPDDGTGGIEFPPRIDLETSEDYEAIGFMFYGEWRGDRWMAFADSVWANVSQDADLKVSRLLPESDAKATVDGNVYQAAVGYRVAEWENSNLLLYAGARYYDIEAKAELKGGILPNKLSTSTSKTWTDAVGGGRWAYRFGNNWGGFVQADYGVGDSKSSWQVFATVGYSFSWGMVTGGYRYINLDYDTNSYKIDLSLRGPLVGVAFQF
jgi:hypothetical protein